MSAARLPLAVSAFEQERLALEIGARCLTEIPRRLWAPMTERERRNLGRAFGMPAVRRILERERWSARPSNVIPLRKGIP